MTIDALHLRTLAAIVDEGTLDRAAASLNITPSAVSQRVKAMEREIGRVLLQRTKPARPTASGEALLRLARQIAQLERETLASLGIDDGAAAVIPLVINAASLASRALRALAPIAARGDVTFDILREDEAHSTELLRAGTVMAAVTSTPEPVQGCIVDRLGAMRYRAVATPAFVARWFPEGLTADAVADAPTIDFDRKDELQSRFIRRLTKRQVSPPRHHVPASTQFADAVRLGMGWAMLPDMQTDADRERGSLVELGARAVLDVPLFWQRWKLDSPALVDVTAAIRAGAAEALL